MGWAKDQISQSDQSLNWLIEWWLKSVKLSMIYLGFKFSKFHWRSKLLFKSWIAFITTLEYRNNRLWSFWHLHEFDWNWQVGNLDDFAFPVQNCRWQPWSFRNNKKI